MNDAQVYVTATALVLAALLFVVYFALRIRQEVRSKK